LVEDPDHMGVVDPARKAALSEEALTDLGILQALQALEGDDAVELAVPAPVDDPEGPLSELLQDLVSPLDEHAFLPGWWQGA
jgi:hypothetical protein